MDWNWSGDGLGVAARMFCTEVGERGNPQESVVLRAMHTMSLVTSLTQRESCLPRLRCPRQVVGHSGDEMHIGMGRGAEDASIEGAELPDRSMVDIANGPQV